MDDLEARRAAILAELGEIRQTIRAGEIDSEEAQRRIEKLEAEAEVLEAAYRRQEDAELNLERGPTNDKGGKIKELDALWDRLRHMDQIEGRKDTAEWRALYDRIGALEADFEAEFGQSYFDAEKEYSNRRFEEEMAQIDREAEERRRYKPSTAIIAGLATGIPTLIGVGWLVSEAGWSWPWWAWVVVAVLGFSLGYGVVDDYAGRLGGPHTGRNIPQAVKVAVSVRDGGLCRHCGSDRDVHFDHIVPYSKGGNSSVHNVQLLCGRCNRRKGNRYVG